MFYWLPVDRISTTNPPIRLLRGLNILLVLVFLAVVGCAKKDAAAPGATPVATQGKGNDSSPADGEKQENAVEDGADLKGAGEAKKAEQPRLLAAEMKASVAKIEKCIKKFVEQLEIDRYEQGEVVSGRQGGNNGR